MLLIEVGNLLPGILRQDVVERVTQRRLVEVSQAREFEVLLDPIKSNVNKLGDQCCVRVPVFDPPLEPVARFRIERAPKQR